MVSQGLVFDLRVFLRKPTRFSKCVSEANPRVKRFWYGFGRLVFEGNMLFLSEKSQFSCSLDGFNKPSSQSLHVLGWFPRLPPFVLAFLLFFGKVLEWKSRSKHIKRLSPSVVIL